MPLKQATLQNILDDYVANQTAIALLLGITPTKNIELTAGFTIDNFLQLVNTSLNDTAVTGWMFTFGLTPSGSNDTPMVDITIQELRAGVAFNSVFASLGSPLIATIQPKIHFQKASPGTATPVDRAHYPNAAMYSGTGYFDKSDLKISHFTYYTDWARAAFIRRTDLRFLASYVTEKIDESDGVFFSGSFIDFESMQNAFLRIDQLNLPNVDDGSQTFTLKGEPIVKTLVNKIENGAIVPTDTLSNKKREADDNMPPPLPPPPPPLEPENETKASPDGVPMGFTFIPCPTYWRIGEAAFQELNKMNQFLRGKAMPSLAASFASEANIETLYDGDQISAKTPSLNLGSVAIQFLGRLFNRFTPNFYKIRSIKKNVRK